MRLPVYLDHAATTPVDAAVAEAMSRCLTAEGAFANPASSHAAGRAAAALVEGARARVADLVGAEREEIVFTSGATESNNLAVLGVARANADRGRHLVTSRIEHRSVLDPFKRLEREGFDITYVAPDDRGVVDPDAVTAALRRDTLLVSIMHVNNEIGVIEDIAAIGAACRARGIAFHTDAAQSVGRLAVDVREAPVDLLSLTAHKIHGPKGIGALFIRRGARALLKPIVFGGGQEAGFRPGTLPTHQIAGFGVAAERARETREADFDRIAALRDRLAAGLEALGGTFVNGAGAPRVPHILNVSFSGVDGESLVAGLGALAVSRGSACSSGSGHPSHVLRALRRGQRLAESSLRFSLGRSTTLEEIEFAIAEVSREVRRLREVSPGGGQKAPSGGAARESGLEIGLPACADIERLFRELPGRGVLEDGAGEVLHGEAGGPAEEVWVRLHLLIDGDTVKDARFEARGCPHTLAAAAWLTSRLAGRSRAEASRTDPQAWARALGVPIEKLGRLFVIEDALRSALRSGAPMAHDQ